jgi:hypothetical protein
MVKNAIKLLKGKNDSGKVFFPSVLYVIFFCHVLFPKKMCGVFELHLVEKCTKKGQAAIKKRGVLAYLIWSSF